MKTVQALLSGILDYAGLFPPAKLDMGPAVQNHASYLAGDSAWMVGRFVVPAARLDEFDAALDSRGAGAHPWRVSALIGADTHADLSRILDFNQRWKQKTPPVVIDSVEIKADTPDDVTVVAKEVPGSFERYVEVPLSNQLDGFIQGIGATGMRAKIRTGGVTPDLFPTIDDIARFIESCRNHRVIFKATAGLHHPVRSAHPLTYEPGSATGVMHGFLNVFVGAVFAHEGCSTDDLRAILEETSVAAFAFDHASMSWRTRRISMDRIAAARTEFATSFGSCSVEEPVHDLKGLHLI